MKYNIFRTDKADEQLRNIMFYIVEESGSKEVALNYLNKIEKAINRLQEFPLSGSVSRYAILRKQGYRVLIVERHMVFYKIDEINARVVIYAIVDGRQEYKNLV